MKAAVFKSLGKPLEVEVVADPTPRDSEVVVAVERCGICGSDLHMTEDPIFNISPGFVLGHEYMGQVVALGPSATTLRLGDRVSVLPIRGCGKCQECNRGRPAWCSEMILEGGGYAEFARVDERQCIRLPHGISADHGALVEPLSVGLHAVKISEMRAGARVMIFGAGPIGLATAFWAKAAGAQRVAVLASSNRRRDLALAMGATHFFDANEGTYESVVQQLGGAPDVVFEAVGKPGLLSSAINFVRPHGTVVLVGLCTVPDSIVPFLAVAKEVRIQCAVFYDVGDFEASVDALDAGAHAPLLMITDRILLEGMPEAFEALRHRSHQCKVMVTCSK